MNHQVLLTEMFTATLMFLQTFFFTLIVLLPLGFLAALGRMSKLKIVDLPVHFYILIMYGIPLILQLLFMFYALKPLLGIQPDRVLAVEVVLTLSYIAYFVRIYRGGPEFIPNGQREVMKVLGYIKSQVFSHTVLPQMIKRTTPPMGNGFVTLMRDTSLAQVVGVVELLEVISQWVSSVVDMTPLVITGLLYLVMSGIVTRTFIVLESWLSYYQ